MNDHEHPESAIKVVDRRHFTAAGERRADVPESEPAPPVPPPGPPPAADAAAKPNPPAAKEPAKGKEADRPPADAKVSRLAAREISFLSLVEELSVTGAMQLGAMPHPQTQRPQVDIEGARETIDLLGVLQEKTRGNLSQEEARYLDEVLYQLRMAYMELMQRAAAAARQPAKR